MGFWTTLIFIVIILHFVVGFGYLMYKLSPKKKHNKEETLAHNTDD
jgi:hypothetical protein